VATQTVRLGHLEQDFGGGFTLHFPRDYILSSPHERHRRRPEISKLWIFALLVAVFAVYAPTLGNDFTLDDKSIARTTLPNGQPNVMVAEVRPLSEYFASGYWTGYSGKKSSLYRPFTVLSYAMTNAWFGTAATTHHLINIFLHVWAVLLAFLLLTRLSIRRFPALFGSAAFGLNAIHSEVVAGIVGRAELLAFCLGAQALLFLAFCSKESALAWAPSSPSMRLPTTSPTNAASPADEFWPFSPSRSHRSSPSRFSETPRSAKSRRSFTTTQTHSHTSTRRHASSPA